MSSGIQDYWPIKNKLTNNAEELTPYRFEFKCDTNINVFLPLPRFEPGQSLG
jgi:hypothetical protein